MAYNLIKEHYNRNWGDFSEHQLDKGPMHELPSDFRVLKFEPNKKRKMWTYATCGMSETLSDKKIELHIFSPTEYDSLIELLTVIVHYHNTGEKLNLGHTINFGRPWYEKSSCSYGLLSLPYLDGPPLEWLPIDNSSIRFLWLIPITKEEKKYKMDFGLNALEDKFEENSFNYLEPLRNSVV